MSPEQLKNCMVYGLPMHYANERYIVEGVADLLVTWDKGGRQENSVGIQACDPDKFYPAPGALRHVIDTELDEYTELRPSILSRPARFLKFIKHGEIVWVMVLDHEMKLPPDVEKATECALDRLDSYECWAPYLVAVL